MLLTGAVICEYNPFHNGHKYLLDAMKADGCECIVAVMSGSFTQRGDVAIYSKFQRARDALRGGADIVIELPAVWAVSTAQRFAQGGCDIIKALGCVDRVYFGSECGDVELLRSAAKATEDEKVNELVKKLMQEGEYYPSALQKAVSEIYGEKIAAVIEAPNNTLGIEYMKCLKDSDTQVRTVKRTGVEHDSKDVYRNFASASNIRDLILRGGEYKDFLPESNTVCHNPAFLEYGERAFLYKLREITREDIEKLPDVSEGLENRIYDAIRSEGSVDEILTEIKTKRYTHARLRRILTCALLGVTKEHQEMSVPYVRVLGFNSCGELLVKKLKDTCPLPIVINVAKGYGELSEDAREIFDIDIHATDIRTVFEKSPSECGRDFTYGIIKN